METPSKNGIRIWLWTGIFMVLVQVLLGGITRLTDSGLSMAQWEPVKGTLPPLTEQAWQDMFEAYQQTPEFQKVNYEFSLSEFKNIFWWEYIHRTWARLIGFVFFFPFLFFHFKGLIDTPLRKRLGIVVLLGALQAVMGWIMVKSGLVDNPWVSPVNLSAHLLLALALFSYMYWIILDLDAGEKDKKLGEPKLRRFLNYLIPLVVLQIFFGGLMAGTDAARLFHTWPDMDGELLPGGMFRFQPVLKNLINNISTIQFIHRNLAIIVFFSIVIFWWKSRESHDKSTRLGANFLLLAVAAQFTLGVFTLLQSTAQQIQVELAAMHQLCAFLLTGVLVYLHYNFRHSKLKIY